MTGLDKITKKLTDDARADADAKLAAAKAECDSIDADYEARAKALRDSMLADAEREASSRIARLKSSIAIEKRNVVLAERSALVDEAFSHAMNDILSMAPEDYRKLLVDILSSVLTAQVRAEEDELKNYGPDELETAESYEVVLNQADFKAHGEALIAETAVAVAGRIDPATVKKLKLSETTSPIDGGLILKYGDVEVNCSLSMIFSRLRETLEGEVYGILFKVSP